MTKQGQALDEVVRLINSAENLVDTMNGLNMINTTRGNPNNLHRVVFVTDGAYNVEVKHPEVIKRLHEVALLQVTEEAKKVHEVLERVEQAASGVIKLYD